MAVSVDSRGMAVESFRDCMDEIRQLSPLHHSEVGLLPPEDFDVDWDRYQAMADNDLLQVFTYRPDEDLDGYALVQVHHHLHYKKVLCAKVSAIYLKPQHRGRGVGKTFIRFIECLLREEGIKVLFQNVTTDVDFSPTLLTLGYRETGISFLKEL